MTVDIALVRSEEALEVYRWHRGFQAANDAIFPRKVEDIIALVDDRTLWLAREGDDYLGLAYADYKLEKKELEVGGLMVAVAARGRGIGSTLMKVALGQGLLEVAPLSVHGARVVAHVLKSNQMPRAIIERHLRFRWVDDIEELASNLPGLKADSDGMVRGDEFEMVIPDSLTALAEWAASWDNALPNGEPAQIEMTGELTLSAWADAFRDMLPA